MFLESDHKDLGAKPSIINIRKEAICNHNFRTVLWTGEHLQLTVMSIPIGGEIGLEMHDDLDQFIKVENGCANVYMGCVKQDVKQVATIHSSYAVIVPAGTWHNIINIGAQPLKLYSIYAPKNHPFGTVHPTKLDADIAGD